jgi:membrane protein required for colicin V production
VSLLDLLLGVIAGTSIAFGFVAGFARVGIGFCAAIAGLIFGFWFYGIPAAWIHKHLSSQTASNFLGFFVVFFAFVIAGALIGKLFSKLFKWTGLSWLDRLLGAGFGFVRGSFIGVAFVAVLLAFSPKPLPNWMVDSKLLPYAVDASNLFAAMAPNALKEAFHDGLAEIRKDWDEQLQKSQRKKPEPGRKKGNS